MAELSEADRTAILGNKYRPNAPKPETRSSLLRRIWASLAGKSPKP